MRFNYSWLILYFLLAFFTYLMLRITFPYFNMNDTQGFLMLKQSIIENKVWKTAFYIHVFSSCFLLFAGFTQFSNRILKDHKSIHRNIGKMYVFILLFVSGPAGFIMSINANGGIYSRIGFLLLSSLWLLFTALAWLYVIKGDFGRHRVFMILSFSLTLSALTLRLWKYCLAGIFHPAPMDLYRIVAWLGWVPNLLVALVLVQKRK